MTCREDPQREIQKICGLWDIGYIYDNIEQQSQHSGTLEKSLESFVAFLFVEWPAWVALSGIAQVEENWATIVTGCGTLTGWTSQKVASNRDEMKKKENGRSGK